MKIDLRSYYDLRFYSGYKTALRDAYQWFEAHSEAMSCYKLKSFKGFMYLLKRLFGDVNRLMQEGDLYELNLTWDEIKAAGGGLRREPKRKETARSKRIKAYKATCGIPGYEQEAL